MEIPEPTEFLLTNCFVVNNFHTSENIGCDTATQTASVVLMVIFLEIISLKSQWFAFENRKQANLVYGIYGMGFQR